MRILDRYITRSLISVFLSTIVIFVFLFILIDSASNLDEFIDRKVSFFVLIQYYLWYLPTVIVQTSPLACLIAALFSFTHMNNHNEVVVLRASGLNFWQITRPAIVFALVISAVVFFVNERFIPEAESRTRQIKNQNLVLEVDRSKKKRDIIKNLTFYGLKNRLYFIDTFDPNTYEMKGITIIEYDEKQNIEEKIVAFSGQWTGIAWKFYQCHITVFSEDLNTPTKVRVYKEKLLDIKETPEDFLKQRLNVNAMNIRQLRDYIHRFANSGARRALNNLKVDLHQKFAFPFTNIIIMLVGLPFALTTGRRRAQTFTSLGLAVTIGFLYYVTNAVGIALGKGGILYPVAAAWLAPVLFFFLGVYIIREMF